MTNIFNYNIYLGSTPKPISPGGRSKKHYQCFQHLIIPPAPKQSISDRSLSTKPALLTGLSIRPAALRKQDIVRNKRAIIITLETGLD